MKQGLFILFILLGLILKAQEPSHFILGEEELAGLSIYDLYQDHSQNYWIATNNGIYKYNGYSIKKIHCKEMTSSSVFSIKEDYNNAIYCNNLSGQIFQIKEDSCTVFYTIPDHLMSSNISFEFDNQNTLTISSTEIFQINHKSEFIKFKEKNLSASSFLYRKSDSSLILYNLSNLVLTTIKDGSYKSEKIVLENLIYPKFFYFKDSLVAFDGATKKLIPELTDSQLFNLPTCKSSNRLTNYYSDNERIWMANLSGGLTLYQPGKTTSKPFFKKKIISSFLKDKEGNILLGTFNEGIIVILNINFKNINFDEKVSLLASNNEGDVFFGTQNGKVYSLDSLGEYTEIISGGIQRIELLEYLNGQNTLLINSNQGDLIHLDDFSRKKINKASIKDVYQYNDHIFYLASNTGLLKYDINLNQPPVHVESLNDRSYSVGIDHATNTIYCGTAVGLKLKTKDSTFIFKYKGKPIFSSDILAIKDTVYVTTKKYGVLIFSNNKIVDSWNVASGLLSNYTKFIKEYHHTFFVSTNLALIVLDSRGNVTKIINKSHGLNSNNIIDFEIVNHTLWILTNKGVQIIDLKHLNAKKFKPIVQIKSLLVNGVLSTIERHRFNYTENRFVFDIDAKTLKYQNDIYYLYQLEGLDKEWIRASYENHIIEYKSLPPNKYTFRIKAIHKKNSSEVVEYSFIISAPFWKTWWFFGIILITLFVFLFIIFKVQINKQKQKALIQHQLDTVQLKALKSQMNPHFIFNSLNSIQELILQQDKENAYNYISKFALLVRKILHHSDKEFIDFEDEVNILNIYLELEQLRFKKDFSYSMITNDITDIEITPMLIQPFIENALKHGLLHKKGEKTLHIEFSLKNEILLCTITDNGIGRMKSQEIKNRQRNQHQSFSVESIQTRFELLKNIYGDEVGIAFIDLTEDGLPIGTTVSLKIPINRRF